MGNNRGITLVEVIMVISILSIILLISTLKGNTLLAYRERKELREFTNDINYARNRAIIESTLYSVNLRPVDNYYIICKFDVFDEVIKMKKFTSGIKIKNTSIHNNEITFNYSGAPKDPKTLYLESRKGEQIRITITPATGKVNIYFD